MKPIFGIRYEENRAVLHADGDNLVKSEETNYDSDKKVEEAWIIDALRNTYISENTSFIFCKDLLSDPLSKISPERQTLVDELLHKFACLTMEERLLFFLRLPTTNTHTAYDPKLNILASRVEIRRTAAWIRSHLQIDCDSSIPKRDVYDKYMEYCLSSRMIPISIADFGKVMKHMYPSVRPRRLGTRGKSQYCYAGMSSCQDVKRPDLYDDFNSFTDDADCFGPSYSYDIQFGGNNLKPQHYLLSNCELKNSTTTVNPFILFDKKNNIFEKSIDTKLGQFDFSQDCSAFVKRCKQRNSTLCSKNKFKKPTCFNSRSLKDFQLLDQNSDCQVEEEIAQYFQSDDSSTKLVKESNPANLPFHRSISFTGGSNVHCLLQNRSQSSVAIFAPKWPNEDNIYKNRHSASCVGETIQRTDSHEATERFGQLKLRTPSSQNSAYAIENHNEQCGFTPISPSPTPWTQSINISNPLQDSQLFLKPENFNFHSDSFIRPRSLSTETKLNLKRDFQHAFCKVSMCCTNECDKLNTESKISDTEAFRSQSLPTFDQNNSQYVNYNPPQIIQQNNELPVSSEINREITTEELGSIFNGSMISNNMCFENLRYTDSLESSQEGLINQLDGIFNGMKSSQNLIENHDINTKMDILPHESLIARTTSQDIFKSNFDQFF